MKSIILTSSFLIFMMTFISVSLKSVTNYWTDEMIRNAYYQSMEYVMRLEPTDNQYSLPGFNHRFEAMLPRNLTYRSTLEKINYYPKLFKTKIEVIKENGDVFTLSSTMMEDPLYE